MLTQAAADDVDLQGDKEIWVQTSRSVALIDASIGREPTGRISFRGKYSFQGLFEQLGLMYPKKESI